MNKLLCIVALFCFNQVALAQPGLIAHWNMDSSANDVSGGGHNGHLHNVTPDVGMDGVMGHGYYFNGSNSWISVPYSPSFNVANYSICATVKVMGYNNGTCHANVIFIRGKTGLGNCVYTLQFNDAPAGIGCSSAVDTASQVFWSGCSAPSATLSVAAMSSLDYTPRIASNVWYKVIATFNDTTYKIYVNGVLMSSATATNAGLALGTGLDSVSIGYDLKDAPAGYPYPFKGVIDDIMLYNRVLSDSEIVHYGDTCGSILSHPVVSHLAHGGNTSYTVTTSITSPIYQWQCNNGMGFANLSNAGPYSGVTTATLTVTGVTATMNNYLYRCLVSNGICSDTSHSAALLTGITDNSVPNTINVYPSPGHNELIVDVNGLSESGMVQIYNTYGQLVIAQQLSASRSNINIKELPSGSYIVKVLSAGLVQCSRITKL